MISQLRPIAACCIALTLGQTLAPCLARADDGGVYNPFSHIPIPAPKPQKPQKAPSNVPARPTPLAPPKTDEPLSCVDPTPNAQLSPFERSIEDYISARYSDNPRSIHYLNQIAIQVFAHPGTQEYVDDLKYIDHQASRAPEAMYDLAIALQNRWEAAYGMELNAKTQDIGATPGQRRDDRVHIGENAGAMIGSAVALAALGLACVRNPTAIPRYNAVFRSLLPALGFAGGALLGHEAATGLNNAGVFETHIPIAPAHVMRLGVEKDDFSRDDATLVRTLVPIILSAGAGEAFYAAAAVESETLAETLLGVIRAIRVVNAAATPAKIDPPVLIASIVVSIVFDKLATAGIEAMQYRDVRNQVLNTGKIVTYGASSGDDITLYRGADALVQSVLGFAAYVNRPVFDANSEFMGGVAEAAKKYGEGTPPYDQAVAELTNELSSKVAAAAEDMDQAGDADYEAYLALSALDHQDADVLAQLSDIARNRTEAYAEAFQTYRQGFDAFISRLEESRKESLTLEAQSDAYNDFFHQYIRQMTSAKDRELAAQFKSGQLPRHAGHALLEAGALLRTTGHEYVQSQADFLMAQVARNEGLIRAALAPAMRASQSNDNPNEIDPGAGQ